MGITEKAYGKINLGLDVIGKRDDGYHLVKMIMQNVDIYDTLTFEETKDGTITITSGSDKVPCDESNLIYKVAKQLKEKFGITKGVKIDLDKKIPVAAGMAGGSADAAATYRALNELWGSGLDEKKLCELAVKLGADIPYCIVGGTALSEGIGEELTTLKDVPDFSLVVAKPDIDVSTGWVYKELDSSKVEVHPDIDGIRASIESGDLTKMCSLIDNVLEKVTRSKYSVIGEIEQILLQNGALGAYMTGSGPTVFAIFDDATKAEEGYRAVRESNLAPECFLTRPINPNR